MGHLDSVLAELLGLEFALRCHFDNVHDVESSCPAYEKMSALHEWSGVLESG